MPEQITAEQEKTYFESRGEKTPEAIEPKEPVETPESGTPEAEPEENRGKFVRHEALHEEREQRKALQTQLRERDAEFARVQERLNILQQSWQQFQSQQQVPATPKFEDDPAQHLHHRAETLDKRLARLEEWEKQQDTQSQQNVQMQQFVGQYQAKAQEFAAKTADFTPAYQYLLNSRAEELTALGFSPVETQEAIRRDELNIAAKAMRDGVNPAERLYALAKLRGYKPAAQQQQTAAADAANKLKNIAAGQKEARSLSSVSGEAKQQLSLKTVGEMSEEDFKAVALDPKKWKALWQ